MKYLIFGVQGMAGHMIAEYLLEQGHTVVGFARTKSAVCPAFCADAQDEKAVEQALGSDEFDYVINAVGVLNQRVECRSCCRNLFEQCVSPSSGKEIKRTKDKADSYQHRLRL